MQRRRQQGKRKHATQRNRAPADAATAALSARVPHEMLLLDLYSALHSLDELTGSTTTDDILSRIFSTFCIGK